MIAATDAAEDRDLRFNLIRILPAAGRVQTVAVALRDRDRRAAHHAGDAVELESAEQHPHDGF